MVMKSYDEQFSLDFVCVRLGDDGRVFSEQVVLRRGKEDIFATIW
jgi:hypothetical protein